MSCGNCLAPHSPAAASYFLQRRPRRSDIQILAGTVACPQCHGKGQYTRHTPNIARFFGLQEPWQDEVGPRSTLGNGMLVGDM